MDFDRCKRLIEKVIPVVIKAIDEYVPDSGKFVGSDSMFVIPTTDVVGNIIIEHSLTGAPDQRRLRIGVNKEGSDKMRSYYLLHDTKAKIREYMLEEGRAEDLTERFLKLYEDMDNG